MRQRVNFREFIIIPVHFSQNVYWTAFCLFTTYVLMGFFSGAIPFICGSLQKAFDNNNRRHRGFTPTELCQGLGRMAVNDNNKKKVSVIYLF